MHAEISRFTIDTADGVAIAAYRATPAGRAKGVVQIAHGMAEHFGRYGHLAARLTEAGYAVYGNDHRGHGASAGAHGLGDFGPGGFQSLVDDMAVLTGVAKRETPGRPLILLGHSMGSWASQLYLLEHHRELAGLALSGTAAMERLLESLLSSGEPVGLAALNTAFEPARTPFDWLSRDEAEVDAYIADPLCGFDVGETSLGSLFALGAGASTDARLSEVRNDLPVYIISGEHDPIVGPDQAYTRALIARYQAAGIGSVNHRVYPAGRHEMFNETCREEVEADLIAWLDSVIAATFS
jgi:alpha-beta hydrolase superfamily lysophospholipase